MRLKSTLIMALLLIIIAAYYFLVEQRRQESAERDRSAAGRILTYDKNGIDRFVMINPQGETIEIEKSAAKWKIVSPVSTDASQATVDAILKQLLPGRKLDSITDIGNLSDYGLDPPFATIIFYGTDRPRPDTFFVGDKTPTSPSCYVRIGSSDTVLISREMTHNIMNKNLYHLRDKNFIHLDRGEIDSLRIIGDNGQVAVSMREGAWWVGDPPMRANKQLIDTYLNTLTLAIVYGFPSEDLSELGRFGLEDPEMRMVLYSGPDRFDIAFGSRVDDRIHAVRTGLDKVLLLDVKVLEAFDWTEEKIESRNISFFEPQAVARIDIEASGTRHSIVKGPDGWSLGDAPVNRVKVQSFLKMLREIRFVSILERGIGDPAALPDPHVLEITLVDEGGFPVEHISFFRSGEDEERAASLSTGVIGLVGPGTIRELAGLVESR